LVKTKLVRCCNDYSFSPGLAIFFCIFVIDTFLFEQTE
jgi:hypothetical protein